MYLWIIDFGKYYHFLKQWVYVQNYLIDRENGGWYWGGIDEELRQKMRSKGTIRKAAYHAAVH